jgi:hypothetical protein
LSSFWSVKPHCEYWPSGSQGRIRHRNLERQIVHTVVAEEIASTDTSGISIGRYKTSSTFKYRSNRSMKIFFVSVDLKLHQRKEKGRSLMAYS